MWALTGRRNIEPAGSQSSLKGMFLLAADPCYFFFCWHLHLIPFRRHHHLASSFIIANRPRNHLSITLQEQDTMDIFTSPHVPPSLIAAVTLYPFLFIVLGKQQWVIDILPKKSDTQKYYHLCNKIVASVHSTIMTSTGLYLLLTVDWSKNDISTYKTPLTPFLVGLELGYLTQDTAFEFYQRARFGVGSNLILFHHVSVILGSVYYLYALTLDNPGPFFIGMLSLMNMSTPILHFRWVLQSRGCKFDESRLKRFVDTALMVTYFWCRIFGNWWMGVAIGAKLGMSWYQAPFYIGKKFTITTTTMFLMNVAWWLILAKQWFKSFKNFYFPKEIASKKID